MVLLTVGIQAENRFTDDTPFFQQEDKQAHILVCSAISLTTTSYYYKTFDVTYPEAMFLGFVTGMVVGVGKEMYDDNFDNQDIKADIIGSALGTVPHFVLYKW